MKQYAAILIWVILSISILWCVDVNQSKSLIDMIYVEGGAYVMGKTDDGGAFDDQQAHQVKVSSFFIGKYEITQKQWLEVMGDDYRASDRPDTFLLPSVWEGDNLPKESVSWYESLEFCNKLSALEGLLPCYKINKNVKDSKNQNSDDEYKWTVSCNWSASGYRLPTEAEWEYAARGGNKSKGYEYSGSNDVGVVAWYNSNSDSKTHLVGQKLSNELGIYDMSGNIWEWCWDWYDKDYYSVSIYNNPYGAVAESTRVLRGGSWRYYDRQCRIDRRFNFEPYGLSYTFGFRVCRAAH
jgi:formylglycine-generating enzyme